MSLTKVARFTVDIHPRRAALRVELSGPSEATDEALAEAYEILQGAFQRSVGMEQMWEVSAIAEARPTTTSYRMDGAIFIDRTLWWQADAIDGPYAANGHDLVETNRWLCAQAAVAAAAAREALATREDEAS